MAVWRRKALEAFPELSRELNDKHEIFSIYALWFELSPMAKQAHENGDEPLLDRIYGFALWCYRQKSQELWNSVAVAFYEHLLVDVRGEFISDVVARLPDDVIADVWGLWELITPHEKMERARQILRDQKRPLPSPRPDPTQKRSDQPKRVRKRAPAQSDRRRPKRRS